MGDVLNFPKRQPTDSELQLAHMRTYIQEKFVELANIRANLLKLQEELQKEIQRVKRSKFKTVPNADHDRATKD